MGNLSTAIGLIDVSVNDEAVAEQLTVWGRRVSDAGQDSGRVLDGIPGGG